MKRTLMLLVGEYQCLLVLGVCIFVIITTCIILRNEEKSVAKIQKKRYIKPRTVGSRCKGKL